MNFANTDIIKILGSAILNKFQDFSPSHFEDFIAQMFKDNGYKVKQTAYSGDYGADLILEKNKDRIAVQIKRYAKSNKVGVKDINQIIGARDYYSCKDAFFITTSSFTNQGKNLAKTVNVRLWSWNQLQKYISMTYLDIRNYYDYFHAELTRKPENMNFTFLISHIYQKQMKRIGLCTLIHAIMKNKTNRNLPISLGLPSYVTKTNDEIEALCRFRGHFTRGTIYAGCKVKIAFIFKTEQLPKISKEDKIVFQWYDQNHTLFSKKVSLKAKVKQDNKELAYAIIFSLILLALIFAIFSQVSSTSLISIFIVGFFVYVFLRAIIFILS